MAKGADALTALWGQADYFTETTNMLVAVLFSWLAVRAQAPVSSRALAVAAVSEAIVMLVYWPVLYPTNPPKPGEEIANVLIHGVVPMMVIAYCIMLARKATTTLSDPLRWMAYPVGYTVFIMARGILTGKYPYFFFNPAKVGVPMVIADIVIIGIIYFGAGHVFVWLDRKPRQALA